MTHFLLIVVGAGLVAATLPVVIELAVLTGAFLLPARKLQQRRRAAGAPVLAVVVPAHNEELLIARSIRSVLASASASASDARVLVIAHNCVDQTAERAAQAGAEVLVYNDANACGKGFALRYGFEKVFSQGADAALVIDADSTISPNLIGAVRDALAAGADAVQCRYDMASSGGRAMTRIAALALRGFNLIRPLGRDRLGLSAGILGNGFAISKSVFSQTPYQALSLVEDLEYHIHLVLNGRRVGFVRDASVRAALPLCPSGETTQRSRWEGGRFSAARQWLWPLATQTARGRLRLIEPLLDLSSLPLAFATLLLLIGLCLPVAWLQIYFALALLIVAVHVLAAAWTGENFFKELGLLCMAPGYVLWKLCLIPRLLRGSSASAAWVRTERAPANR